MTTHHAFMRAFEFLTHHFLDGGETTKDAKISFDTFYNIRDGSM